MIVSLTYSDSPQIIFKVDFSNFTSFYKRVFGSLPNLILFLSLSFFLLILAPTGGSNTAGP